MGDTERRAWTAYSKAEWQGSAHLHEVPSAALPYGGRTYGWHLTDVRVVLPSLSVQRKKGCVIWDTVLCI
jgi:hypothetical protein